MTFTSDIHPPVRHTHWHSHVWMARLLMTAVAVGAVLTCAAAYINPTTRLRLRQANAPSSRADTTPEMPYQPLMVMIDGEDTVEQLLALDVIIYYRRDDILLVSVPVQRLQEALDLEGVVCVEISGDMSSHMNLARPFGNVNRAQDGADGLPMGYDGTGVVTGFTDIGFDPHHIAFRDRVSAIYDFKPQLGVVRSATTPQQIQDWYTDILYQFHATHVANILGGNYRGNGYYGVATGAEMVATTSDLSDVGILSGVEAIIEYARAQGKPAVINMSLGSSLGPHDGTDLFCRYLSRCARDATICLSAGNTSYSRNFASRLLANDTDVSRVMVNTYNGWDGFNVQGMTEIWCDGAQPISFRIEVFDLYTRQVVYASPWIGSEHELQSIEITQDNTPEWGAYMSGSIAAETGTSVLNDRYNISVLYDTHTTEVSPTSDGRWSRYYTSLAIKGGSETSRHNAMAYFFPDAHMSYLGVANSTNAPEFSSDGTISDMCTAPGVIAVGACNSRNTAPALHGDELHWKFQVGDVAEFSSYSTRPGIPRLPHIAAPGNYVVSATSTPFLENVTELNHMLVSMTEVDGERYFWMAECGTSMASPYAAGVIALWLQADPTLTTSQIIDIAQSTALTDYPDIDDPRWGAGCINATGGLRFITATSAIAQRPKPVITLSADNRLCVHNSDLNPSDIAVYAMSGVMVDHTQPLAPGVYVVDISGYQSVKLMVRTR